MDEVITCKCGNQRWIIGEQGVRCSECYYYLMKGWVIFGKVNLVNKKIDELARLAASNGGE